MSNNNTSGGDGGDGSIWWTIFKIVAFIIGVIVLIRFLIWLLVGLVGFVLSLVIPALIIGLVLFLGYKLLLGGSSSEQPVETGQPALLEYDDTEVSLDDELDVDPLEKKFQELERNS